MNELRIETIVTDMDDTLFDGEGKINDYTLETMQECKRRGIRVIPASGRAQASMEPFMRRLDTGMPYIACNGAQLVTADHKVYDAKLLSAELAREICGFLQDNGFYVQAYKDDCFFHNEDCDISRQYTKSSGTRSVAVGNLLEYLTFPVPKILSVSDPAEVARLYPIAGERFAGRVSFTVSKPYFLEAEPAGVTKGAALRKLAEQIGLDPQTTLVFGDSLNDVSMLQFSPNSVAVGNARDEVKQAATYVCEPNTQNGLARFVREHVLGMAL